MGVTGAILLPAAKRVCRGGFHPPHVMHGRTGGRVSLGPGTLYTILSKFEEEGLICETQVEGRKRTYRITDLGRAMYRAELARLRACIHDAEKEGEP